MEVEPLREMGSKLVMRSLLLLPSAALQKTIKRSNHFCPFSGSDYWVFERFKESKNPSKNRNWDQSYLRCSLSFGYWVFERFKESKNPSKNRNWDQSYLSWACWCIALEDHNSFSFSIAQLIDH